MFCPDCGQSDQEAGKYCKRCGKYLPDTSFASFNRSSPQGAAGRIVLGNCVGLAMFLIAFLFFSVFSINDQYWPGFLAGAAWGMVLVTTFVAFRLYRRLRRMPNQEVKILEKVDSTQARHPLAAADTSRIVEVESATEETTALLKIGADTKRDG